MKTVKTLSLGLLALAMLGGAAGVNAAGPEPWTPQSLSEALKSLPVVAMVLKAWHRCLHSRI